MPIQDQITHTHTKLKFAITYKFTENILKIAVFIFKNYLYLGTEIKDSVSKNDLYVYLLWATFEKETLLPFLEDKCLCFSMSLLNLK